MSETYSKEQMVAELVQERIEPAPEPAQAEEPAPVEAAEEEDLSATTDDSDGAGETQAEDAETGDEAQGEDEGEVTEVTTLEPPQWWNAEDKAIFSTLSEEQAAAVARNYEKQEAVVQKSKQEAVEAKRMSQAEAEGFKALAARLSEVLPQAEKAFGSRWEGMTPEVWGQLLDENPQEYIRLKHHYDAEQQELQRLRDEEKQASAVSQQAHFAEQRRILMEKAPELASNNEVLSELGQYIIDSGIPKEAIANATADELIIVNKARLWDLSQKKVAQSVKASKEKPVNPPQRSMAPTTARTATISPQKRQAQQLQNRFAQTKTKDDLVAIRTAEWAERLKG